MQIVHKMRCPRHFLLKPGRPGFFMEPDKLMKNFTEETCKRFGVSRWKKKRDKYGQPIRNDKDYYQPNISGAYAIEHIYDPLNPICIACKNRCWKGKGQPNTFGIKRLHGKNYKGADIASREIFGK